MMLYGFIVMAFLVINLDDRSQMIPFASMEACKIAEVTVERMRFHRDYIFCVSTGA